MLTEINIKELMGPTHVQKRVLDSLDNTVIKDKYQSSLGKIISCNSKTKIAKVDVFDEDPIEFKRALKRHINRRIDASHVSGYRSEALKAAEDLHYGEEVIDKIKRAGNDSEIRRIMKEARLEKFK